MTKPWGAAETEAFWREFLRVLRTRGLQSEQGVVTRGKVKRLAGGRFLDFAGCSPCGHCFLCVLSHHD